MARLFSEEVLAGLHSDGPRNRAESGGAAGVGGGSGDIPLLGFDCGSSPPDPRTDAVPLIPVRMLNEFTYCHRLAYLEWVQGEWSDSLDTLDGEFGHRNVDRDDQRPVPAGTRPTSQDGVESGEMAAATGPTAGDPPVDPAADLVDSLPAAPTEQPVQYARHTPRPAAAPEGEDVLHARSLQLESPREGLVAKLDLLELEGNVVTPVDYKRGKPPANGVGAWEPELVQLCAQALILRDNGYQCESGVLYYIAARRRVPVMFDSLLVERTRELVRGLREMAARGTIPPPLEDSPKCPRCSLVGICLPDETNFVRAWQTGAEPVPPIPEPALNPGETGTQDTPRHESRRLSGDEVGDELLKMFGGDVADGVSPGQLPEPVIPAGRPIASQGSSATKPPDKPASKVRRLLPELSQALPLYVQTQGTVVGKAGDRLTVKLQGSELASLRLLDVSQVCLFGNVMVSAQALRELMGRGIPIVHLSYGGWFCGLTMGLTHRNVELRIRQYQLAGDELGALRIARALVAGKLRNCRTLLRRHLPESRGEVLKQLADWTRRVERADSAATLLGLEGMAAKSYFADFFSLLPDQPQFDPRGRNRRPPRDPVNAVLSFVYALLTKEVAVALQSVGFDALLGFLHRPRYGRPSLALDLMEEFRPLIGDSTTLTVFNNREVTADSFVFRAGGVALTEAGRRAVMAAYERRLQHEVTHPLFGYKASYRRILEVQARLLARHVLGELDQYPSFTTR
jgi:CRISPR-associated protein Cas1